MGALDILVLLAITAGPTKVAAVYLSMTTGATPELKRQIAIQTVITATIILSIFALFGGSILGLFHISQPALLIAGGIILFIFALHLVLGEDHEEPEGTEKRAPSVSIAAYPLAMPLIASPQGITAVATLSLNATGWGGRLILLAMVLVMMGINLVFLLFADKIFAKINPNVLKVAMRILGLLLCGLAVQLVILGLQRLGVLAAVAGH